LVGGLSVCRWTRESRAGEMKGECLTRYRGEV
jgi:hypothetical protein